MLNEKEILDFVAADRTSAAKNDARKGLAYYDGEHDIKDYRLYYYDQEGNPQEDRYKANTKISHQFFTELVDQQVQYMLPREKPFVTSGIPELEEKLEGYFGDKFQSELSETLTSAIVQGFGYIYAFKDENGFSRFAATDGLGVIEVRAKDASDGVDYVIRWYDDKLIKDGKTVTKIEVWDNQITTYYVEEGGKLELDADQELNPRPHVLYTQPNSDDLYYEDLGYIPFFRLDNNPKRRSGLASVKSLIDDYDLMACGLSNNLKDLVDGYFVVKGFNGDNVQELIQNLQIKKAIGVDVGGDVDIRTVDIPYEARRVKLDIDEKNIYRFGMGFNAAQVGDGNITNIVIKSRYALLDLKCNKLEMRLKAFLWPLVKIALNEINESERTNYTEDDIKIIFERELMTNALDNSQIELTEAQIVAQRVNTLLSVAEQLGDEAITEAICDALGLDYDDIKEQMPNDLSLPDNDVVVAIDTIEQ